MLTALIRTARARKRANKKPSKTSTTEVPRLGRDSTTLRINCGVTPAPNAVNPTNQPNTTTVQATILRNSSVGLSLGDHSARATNPHFCRRLSKSSARRMRPSKAPSNQPSSDDSKTASTRASNPGKKLATPTNTRWEAP
jgi:hypothetical protein